MSRALLEVTGLGPRQGPMSIDEIIAEAENMLGGYNPNIPLRFYLRSADAINKQVGDSGSRKAQESNNIQAQAYERDGNEEEAFKFYYRHAILISKKVAKHPEVKTLNILYKQRDEPKTLEQDQHMAAWRKAKHDVELNVERMEMMKPSIKRRYEAFQQALARRRAEEEHAAQLEQRNNAYSALVGGVSRMSVASSQSSYGYGRTQQLDPSESSDLAVKLAHNEFRGAGFRGPSPRSSSSPRQRSLNHRGTFFSDDSDDDISTHIKSVGQRREQAFTRPESRDARDIRNSRTNTANRAPQYPSVPKQSVSNDRSWYGNSPDSTPSLQDSRLDRNGVSPPPMRPPKGPFYEPESPPPIPDKVRTPSPVEAPDTEVLDPRKYTFMASATTEDGRPLRTLFINPTVRSRFLTIALANTQRNLETCGILCGRLVSNAFFVSKLVIPEQESTSDTCDTINEGALFDYCDSENLMTLGWIHTHPTQTCFMSSRDLHTHSGYQVQLSESIAIVCAPRHEPS
jgi:STAM-binding protein